MSCSVVKVSDNVASLAALSHFILSLVLLYDICV
jgi:hypothetical protein